MKLAKYLNDYIIEIILKKVTKQISCKSICIRYYDLKVLQQIDYNNIELIIIINNFSIRFTGELLLV